MCQYIYISLLSLLSLLLLVVVLFIIIIYYYYCYYYYHYYYHYYYILMFRCPSFFAVIDFESMGYCQLAKLGHERSK